MISKSNLAMMTGALLATFSAYALQFAADNEAELKTKTPAQISEMYAHRCARTQARQEVSAAAPATQPDMQSDFMKACAQDNIQWKQRGILATKIAAGVMLLTGLGIAVTGWRSKTQKPSEPDSP